MSRYRAAKGCDTATVHHDTALRAEIRAAQRAGARAAQRAGARAAQGTLARGDTSEGGGGGGDATRPVLGHDTTQCALPGRSARGLCA